MFGVTKNWYQSESFNRDFILPDTEKWRIDKIEMQ